MAKKQSYKSRLFKVKGCPELDEATLKLVVKYLQYAVDTIGLKDTEIKIRLLGASPTEPITTGCYNPTNKTCSTIIAGRHMVDWCRTLAHELTHMKQDIDGRLNQPFQEIGGDVEDGANIMSGRITKHFIKNILTKEDKQKLGLGSYGD